MKEYIKFTVISIYFLILGFGVIANIFFIFFSNKTLLKSIDFIEGLFGFLLLGGLLICLAVNFLFSDKLIKNVAIVFLLFNVILFNYQIQNLYYSTPLQRTNATVIDKRSRRRGVEIKIGYFIKGHKLITSEIIIDRFQSAKIEKGDVVPIEYVISRPYRVRLTF